MSADRSVSDTAAPGRPSPSLYYLRTFHAMASERSFTRAGELLHLSQPAVSAHIRILERYYRTRLVEIRHRRVHLTAEGQALFSYTQRVFHLLHEADQAVDATRRAERGFVTLAASTTVGNYLLPPLLGILVRDQPAVEVDVRIGTTADAVQRIRAEDVPFGLVEAPVNHRDLDVEAVGEDEMILIALPSHRWARVRPVNPTELREEPLLRREAGSGTQVLVDGALEQAAATMSTAMVLGSTEALKQAVLAGLGVAWVPRITVLRELSDHQLTAVPVPDISLRRTLSLIRLRGVTLSPASEVLVNLVRAARARGDRLGTEMAANGPPSVDKQH